MVAEPETELDIERPGALVAYLRETGRIGADEAPRVSVLAGGVSNRTVLVERANGEAWVVKQALAKLRVQVDWFSSPERIHREALGLRWLEEIAPPGTTTPLVFEDHEHHLLGMEAVPQPHENWKTMLLAGRLELDHVEQFARLLGTVHRVSNERKGGDRAAVRRPRLFRITQVGTLLHLYGDTGAGSVRVYRRAGGGNAFASRHDCARRLQPEERAGLSGPVDPARPRGDPPGRSGVRPRVLDDAFPEQGASRRRPPGGVRTGCGALLGYLPRNRRRCGVGARPGAAGGAAYVGVFARAGAGPVAVGVFERGGTGPAGGCGGRVDGGDAGNRGRSLRIGLWVRWGDTPSPPAPLPTSGEGSRPYRRRVGALCPTIDRRSITCR